MPRTYIITPPEERFWRHVDKNGPLPKDHEELGNCWLWVGARIPSGYGYFWNGVKLGYAHRFIYGAIPKGLQISHLCEVTSCVRRSHLSVMTPKENMRYGNGKNAQKARATRCHRGHPFDEANTFIRKNGTRQCLACNRLRASGLT